MGEVLFDGKYYKDIDEDAQRTLHSVNIHTFRYFPKDKVWMASDATARHFGIKKFYRISEDPESGPNIVYKMDREKDRRLYYRASNSDSVVSEQLRSRDGETYYKVSLSVLERDDDNIPTILSGIIEDFDEHMTKTEFIQVLSDDYHSAFYVDFTKDQVIAYRITEFMLDKYMPKIQNQPSYSQIMGEYIDAEVIEEERAEMHVRTTYESLAKHFSENRIFMHDYRVFRGGVTKYIRLKIVNISEGPGLTKIMVGFADVSDYKQEELEVLAFFDQVTLGSNYNHFSEKLKKENHEGYIVSMDIKDFRMVNDVCGISIGDEVLQEFARYCEAESLNRGFYGHVNADHYVMYLNVSSEDEVIGAMKSLYEKIKGYALTRNLPKIFPYFGVTKWHPGDRIQVRFSEANTAKHKIKNKREVYYGFYRDEDNRAAIEEKLIEDSFENAIVTAEFEIWYQPKFNPNNGKLNGAEALVRWRKPSGELVSPGKFIPVYERNGMIRQLDEYVFYRTCMQLKEWVHKYPKMIPVSVNLSRISLYYEDIVDTFRKMIAEIGLDPQLVPLEITESAAVDNKDIGVLTTKLYDVGFPLHIDDFGAGYSSLSTLNSIRLSNLKLDKSLIDYIGDFAGDRLIKHTIALAKDLGIDVTAEGVEKAEQVKFLTEAQCDSIQGFYYSKPLPASEFEKLLEALNE